MAPALPSLRHRRFVQNAVTLTTATVLLLACQHTTMGEVDNASVTSARPQATVTTSRTIDNAGWVDPAGRTSDETSRSEMSGMRGTEVGSERVTGTPGTGLSVPTSSPVVVQESGGSASAPAAASVAGGTSGPPVDQLGPRLASARCDRENRCGHVGKGKRFGSLDACRTTNRESSTSQLRVPACEKGVDASALAKCLTAERNRSCNDARSDEALPACQAAALCGS